MSKTITLKEKNRLASILPGGVPRYIRCYDNGGPDAPKGSYDRYTVVFTGKKPDGEIPYLSMNAAPFNPQGIGQHGSSRIPIDTPSYSHLGKRITFADLPVDCQHLVMQDYVDIWQLLPHIQYEGYKARKRQDDCPYAHPTIERYAWWNGYASYRGKE